MQIRFFRTTEYSQLIELYKKSDQFKVDEVTDSEVGITTKVLRDPESILVVEYGEILIGSVSIIEDGRIALLFRLVVDPTYPLKQEVLTTLVEKAEGIVKSRGCSQVHSIAPSNDLNALMERRQLEFQEGSAYTWFWKKL
jgi:hypothetical protein